MSTTGRPATVIARNWKRNTQVIPNDIKLLDEA